MDVVADTAAKCGQRARIMSIIKKVQFHGLGKVQVKFDGNGSILFYPSACLIKEADYDAIDTTNPIPAPALEPVPGGTNDAIFRNNPLHLAGL